jgi:BolA family transcriptional regulator, general stress-responsive regulator
MTEVERRIEDKLRAEFSPIDFALRNDSQKHAGHAGQTTAHSHLAVRIVSDRFAGLPLVKRHKLVYAALAQELKQEVHALQIEALTPAEAK